MIYHVRARLRDGAAATLLKKLNDGTIESQRPDGPELVASMKRAVIGSDGVAEWTEMCFCNPPLAHERETVLDRFFSDILTEPVDDHQRFDGPPLMDHLKELSG